MEATKIKGEVQEAFTCLNCYETHNTKAGAQKCCVNIERGFTCNECGDEFKSKNHAQECCAYWECSWCGEEFDTKTEADECCNAEAKAQAEDAQDAREV